MKVEAHPLTPIEIRECAEAWFARQVEVLAMCHGRDWPSRREWCEAFLKEELRARLLALGWVAKR